MAQRTCATDNSFIVTRRRKQLRSSGRAVSTPTPLRALSVLVACVIALGHLAQSLHKMVVSHSVCVTHGELVHGMTGHEGTEASDAHDEADRQGVSTDSREHEHEHEHCKAIDTESSSCSHVSPLAPATLASFEVVAPSGYDASLCRRRLLLLAPKTSPPV